MARSKTMFASSVCCTDRFYQLSYKAQALYIQLCLNADGIGAVSNTNAIIAAGGYTKEAFDELKDSGYVILAETDYDSAWFITHFWMSNNIDSRNMGATNHWELAEETLNFVSQRTRIYFLVNKASDCIETGISLSSVFNKDKENKGKKNKGKKNEGEEREATRLDLKPPSIDEVMQYAVDNDLWTLQDEDGADMFISYYSCTGWERNGDKITQWEPLAQIWEQRDQQYQEGEIY